MPPENSLTARDWLEVSDHVPQRTLRLLAPSLQAGSWPFGPSVTKARAPLPASAAAGRVMPLDQISGEGRKRDCKKSQTGQTKALFAN